MSVLSNLFRWRTRVKTGGPELVGGNIETIGSHTADPNAHPQYLKKGQSVPTGQEVQAIGIHEAEAQSHVEHLVRRDELVNSKEDYVENLDDNFNKKRNNFTAKTPKRYIITAQVLKAILDDYLSNDKQLKSIGNGKNLIYIGADGVGRVSNETVGGPTKFVYLSNGTIVESSKLPVLTTDDQSVAGTKTFMSLPKTKTADGNVPVPTADEDLINYKFLQYYISQSGDTRVPIGGCVITVASVIGTASDVHDKYGYGEWELSYKFATELLLWKRIA